MRRSSGAGTMAALMLTCVFGATLLLSLATGASVYRRVADRVEQSAAQRLGLTYITAKIQSYDEAGKVVPAVYVDPSAQEADAVVLYQDIEGVSYWTILYVYDGWLRELFCQEGWPLGPEVGLPIVEAQSLVVTEPAEGLLHLVYTRADGSVDTADVYLRSEV